MAVVSEVVGGFVECICEESNGGEVVSGLYVCVTEEAAVEVGVDFWW